MTPQHLRIAMVTTFYPPYHFGGDGEAIRRLVHALARRGHSVDIIHDIDAYHLLSNGAEPTPRDEPPGVRVHGLRSRYGKWSCLATQQFGRPVVHSAQIRRILSQGFDVIHYHNISLVGGPGILAYGNAIKIYTAHEHWLVCPSHVLWRHNRELCDKKECVRCVLRFGRPPQLWRSSLLLKRKSQHVDAFVTYSQSCADKHKEMGFHRPFSVLPTFLPDAENEASGNAPRESDSNTTPFFLFVGRLELIKGIQDVIPQFTNDSPAELWIAGSGGYEPQLRALAANSTKIRFLGHRTASELRSLYRRAVALIVPSICYEVFPMVVLEAFREGTPIIARRLGPFPEIVAQSNGGLLFDTPDELRQGIARLVVDHELRHSMKRSAKHAFETRWAEDVGVKEYFGLIRSLARKRGAQNVLTKFSNIEVDGPFEMVAHENG